jgi:osomolarity two-component system sensor histidine kinase SLN1
MVKVWISIREQLAGLVFLATSISLTVVALATWYTNHKFVLDVRWVNSECFLAGD